MRAILFFTPYIFAIFASQASAQALDLSKYENMCTDIGFKRKTPAFGECVLELRARDAVEKPNPVANNNNNVGDQSPDHATCTRYGFTADTTDYAQCRMQIDLARKQAVEQQRQYEEQLAAQKKAKDRARGEAALLMGLGMMSGQVPAAGFNSNSLTPPPSMRVYNLPGGKSMTCSTMGAFTNCN